MVLWLWRESCRPPYVLVSGSSQVREWSGVSFVTSHRRHLGQQTLDQVGDCHTGRNGMRVDDQVWNNALCRERHVFMSIRDTYGTLLTMSRGKLVSNLRHLGRSHSDLGELESFGVGGQKHLVNDSALSCSQWSRGVSFCVVFGSLPKLLCVWWNRNGFTNDNIVSGNTNTRSNQSVIVELFVGTLFEAQGAGTHWLFKLLHHRYTASSFLIHVRSEKERSEQTTVNRRLVHNHRVFLIVTRVAGNGHYGILSSRKLSKLQVFWRHGNQNRLLLLCIKILDDTVAQQGFPTEHSLNRTQRLALVVEFLILHDLFHFSVQDFTAVLFRQLQFTLVLAIRIVIDNEQRSIDSSCIGKDLKLSLSNVSNQRDLWRNGTTSSKLSHSFNQHGRVSVSSDPVSVQEHSRCVLMLLWLVVR
ncbi:hypothetical protein OGATHE_006175 [Ogataea polymorpha]|uniref:Uncharacterized protein n=1 Tax=Ogataea polymorpha TaxID=460523 RepID=A0A9P8NU62_9ASCO|nr:hypothetical protein OGATHE_006175 [Ogataea polymorpha]